MPHRLLNLIVKALMHPASDVKSATSQVVKSDELEKAEAKEKPDDREERFRLDYAEFVTHFNERMSHDLWGEIAKDKQQFKKDADDIFYAIGVVKIDLGDFIKSYITKIDNPDHSGWYESRQLMSTEISKKAFTTLSIFSETLLS